MPLERKGHYLRLARQMEPDDDARLRPGRRYLQLAKTVLVLALLDVNKWAITRYAPPAPGLWPRDPWPWIDALERATPLMRAELDRYRQRGPLPLIADYSGVEPDSDKALASIPSGAGAWGGVLLFANGRWIDETVRHFPHTVAALHDVRPKANIGFSVLGPHGHISAHRDPNHGALRLQLPIVVPGSEGQCRLRVGDETVAWREAETIVFDLTAEHEVWNETDGNRVLLMAELQRPLTRPLAALNRLVQYTYRWHPHMRQRHARSAGLRQTPNDAVPAIRDAR